jgi:glycosyltransferase involved in cell wall biosynthesis
MLSLDASLFGDSSGARARHRAYAETFGAPVVAAAPAPAGQPTIHDGPLTVLPVTGRRALLPFTLARALLRHTRGQRPALIIAQDLLRTGLAGVWLRRRTGAPLLVQDHTVTLDNPAWLAEHPRNRVLLRLAHYVLARADALRTVNTYARDAAVRAGMPPERTFVLPLATASQAFAQPVGEVVLARTRAALRLPPGARVLLWVGYPAPVKRVPLLFAILRHVRLREPRAVLAIVGPDDAAQRALAAQAGAAGVGEAVRWHGPVPHAALPAFYQAADVYVLASSYEGAPRVLWEAGAAGVPAVATGLGGAAEVVVEGETGFYVPDTGDAHALAAAMSARILALLADDALRQRLGSAAQQRALHVYNAEGGEAGSYAARWVHVWRQALALGRRT